MVSNCIGGLHISKLKLLDCTLRDGGYLNNWHFSKSNILKINNALEISKVDIVELGYLDEEKGGGDNSTLFDSIRAVDKILNEAETNTAKKVIMIDLFSFDLNKLEDRSNAKIDGIRLAFHKKDIDSAFLAAKKIIRLGYELFFQPMVTKLYTDKEFLELIERVNKLDVYAFYVVDSFGSMSLAEFRRYIDLSDAYLNDSIWLGYHSHNNMQLAFSNAIDLCNSQFNRGVIIDSSIYGMGRGAGNLNTELIADYLNNQNIKKYSIVPLLEVIDEVLTYFLKKSPWGFSPAQYLSASLECHPKYASYLVDKKTIHIADIKEILNKIPLDKRHVFNLEIIDRLYQQFLLTNKTEPRGLLSIPDNKKVLLIASGNSVNDNIALIMDKVESGEYFVIALNHRPQFECDCYFFSNQQRFDEFKDQLPVQKTAVTTNIKFDKDINVVIELKSIAYLDGKFMTNVAILIINYLVSKKVNKVEIAGLDGYQPGRDNYAYDETSIIIHEDLFIELNKIVSSGLQLLQSSINIILITPSIYFLNSPLKVIGVIPARYNSSRFQGKPLCLINNVPMIKRTYQQVCKSKLLDKLVVATDSEKIQDYCTQENIPVIMTSESHQTGTDRVSEVSHSEDFDLYINIQGDEPVIDIGSINAIIDSYKKHKDAYEVYALYKKVDDLSEVDNSNIIKVATNENDELVYMSRLPIPFNKSGESVVYNKQVCVYGFTRKALNFFSGREKTKNEQFEDIELLRFLDLGYQVKMIETTVNSIAVDVPEDIKKVENFLNKNHLP